MAAHKQNIRGEKHTAVVLKVIETDPFGRPTRYEALYDEQTVRITGGEEFVVAWIPSVVTKKGPPPS